MIKTVFVRLQVEGVHMWPDAERAFPEVGFLTRYHRHIFHIEAHARVFHDDRDVEFIMMKRRILQFIDDHYRQHSEYKCYDFGASSCETIARVLIDRFNLIKCIVCEDGENGAILEHEGDLSQLSFKF